MAFDAFIRGLRPESFKFDIVKNKITTFREALRDAEAFIHATKVYAEAKHPESKMPKEVVKTKKATLKRLRLGK